MSRSLDFNLSDYFVLTPGIYKIGIDFPINDGYWLIPPLTGWVRLLTGRKWGERRVKLIDGSAEAKAFMIELRNLQFTITNCGAENHSSVVIEN